MGAPVLFHASTVYASCLRSIPVDTISYAQVSYKGRLDMDSEVTAHCLNLLQQSFWGYASQAAYVVSNCDILMTQYSPFSALL